MHAAYFRPGGVYRDLPDSMPQYKASKIRNAKAIAAEREPPGFAAGLHRRLHARFPKYVDEYETLLTDNRIWKQRTVGIGVVSPERAQPGLHRPDAARLRHRLGPAQEAALRRLRPLDFDIPVGKNGDCYDRYLVRVEMRQSNRIIKQCVDWLRANPGPVITDNHKVAPRAWT
jgi:NADH-quinone oxidoreductase subunit D